MIKTYHRSPKQFTGLEAGQFRFERSQRNHIELAIRVYARLEWHHWQQRISIFNAELNIIREAIRLYLAQPLYGLPPTA